MPSGTCGGGGIAAYEALGDVSLRRTELTDKCFCINEACGAGTGADNAGGATTDNCCPTGTTKLPELCGGTSADPRCPGSSKDCTTDSIRCLAACIGGGATGVVLGEVAGTTPAKAWIC